MVGRAYQAGLLFVVFGGFLYTGGNQSAVGLLCMLSGLAIGTIGLLHDGIPARQLVDRQVDGE